jgi:hypothetical protein
VWVDFAFAFAFAFVFVFVFVISPKSLGEEPRSAGPAGSGPALV